MRPTLVLLLLLLLSSCSPFAPNQQLPPTQTQIAHEAQLLWVNPLTLPDVIESLRVAPSNESSNGKLCAILTQAFIWEPRDGLAGSDVTTFNSVQRSVSVEVDSTAQAELEVAQTLDIIFRRDGNGNPVGSHGGAISVCFSIAELPVGMHIGHLSFQSTSGKAFGYDWAFRVSGTADARTVELPEALQDA